MKTILSFCLFVLATNAFGAAPIVRNQFTTNNAPPILLSGTNVAIAGVASANGAQITNSVTWLSQSLVPSAPSSGYSEYADTSGRRSWIRASDGFTRTWDSTLTGNRIFTLPDASGTVALIGQINGTTVVNQTNFVLNTVYTNGTQTILVRAAVALTGATVSGAASMDLMVDQAGGGSFSLLGRSSMTTTVALALNVTNVLTGVIVPNATYYFTNSSSGAGDSALIVAGTGQTMTVSSGTNGMAGAIGPAGGAISGTVVSSGTSAIGQIFLAKDTTDTNGIWSSSVTNLTLSNSRIIQRIATLTDAATVTPATDSFDGGLLTTLSQTTDFLNPTGTPTEGQKYTLRIKSSTARALTWTNGGSGAQYRGSADLALPTTTSGASLTDYLVFSWNVADSKWDLLGRNFGF